MGDPAARPPIISGNFFGGSVATVFFGLGMSLTTRSGSCRPHVSLRATAIRRRTCEERQPLRHRHSTALVPTTDRCRHGTIDEKVAGR